MVFFLSEEAKPTSFRLMISCGAGVIDIDRDTSTLAGRNRGAREPDSRVATA
jgi:hypothetical protein